LAPPSTGKGQQRGREEHTVISWFSGVFSVGSTPLSTSVVLGDAGAAAGGNLTWTPGHLDRDRETETVKRESERESVSA